MVVLSSRDSKKAQTWEVRGEKSSMDGNSNSGDLRRGNGGEASDGRRCIHERSAK